MKMDLALDILKEEHSKNQTFDMLLVVDKLRFLVAMTVVEQGLNNGSLKESEYVSRVTTGESK
jgi:hypothetical protein